MFEQAKLHFNFQDILSAPRRALKPKLIGINLGALTLGYPVYVVCSYLALLVNGHTLSSAWNRYGIYPFFPLNNGPITTISGWIPFIAGILVITITLLMAGTATSRILYKDLKGNPFYTLREGLGYARRHWRVVVFAPVVLAMIIGIFIVKGIILALIGKIPYVGELVFVGFYPFYMLGAVFTLFCAVVLIIMLLYLAPIVAIWEEDAVGSIFQTFSITWNQPWRLVSYSILVVFLAVIGFQLYGWVITSGYQFINLLFGQPWLMGEKLGALLAWSQGIVFSGYHSFFTYIPGQIAPLASLTAQVDFAALSFWERFVGSLLALFLLVIYGSVLAYGFSIISVGQSLSFLTFKMQTDGENLLTRVDEEELQKEPQDEASVPDSESGGGKGP